MKIGILYLIDRLSRGGTERQLLELMANIDRSRFQPFFGTLCRGDNLKEEKHVAHLRLKFKSFYHRSILRCLLELVDFIRLNQIAIVQTFFQDTTLLVAMSKPFHHARLIGSFRDLGFWRSRKETIKMKLAYPAYDGFIANSNAVKTHFVNADRIAPSKIEVIYNGISLVKRQDEAGQQLKNPPPIVGIVANLNRPVKRVHDFIHAAALVHRFYPEVRFLVVGDGPLRPQLEELSNALLLGNRMTFTGLVQNPIEFIKCFHVGVIASETEGFCNAILEYMACGVPVVATATGGNLEILREGINGFLVSVGDVESLADRVVRLLENEGLRKEIGEANITKVRSEYTLAWMVTRHEVFYKSILAI